MSAAAIKTESPIEDDFVAALKAISKVRVIYLPDATLHRLRVRAAEDEDRKHVFVASQVAIRNYRADFVLAAHFTVASSHVVCVECDGREFHARTNEQRFRDQQRDIEMVAQGIKTLRFSGSRLRADAFKCAREAIAAVGIDLPASSEIGEAMAGAMVRTAWQYDRKGHAK